jgi:hypothetical protein
MITGFFMDWFDRDKGKWFPVEKMIWKNGKYYSFYLQGMLEAIKAFPYEDKINRFDRVIITDDISPGFEDRMPLGRPFTDVSSLDRLGLPTDLNRFDIFEYMARSGGHNNTNDSQLFPEVTPDAFGIYHFYFSIEPIGGIDITKYLYQIEVKDKLFIKDGSIYHENFVLGMAPGYINDFSKCYFQAIELNVSKVNHHIYKTSKILCHAQINGNKFIPFSDSRYEPLANILAY